MIVIEVTPVESRRTSGGKRILLFLITYYYYYYWIRINRNVLHIVIISVNK